MRIVYLLSLLLLAACAVRHDAPSAIAGSGDGVHIFGGVVATGDPNYMSYAALFQFVENGEFYTCTATPIAPDFVLVSAHCLSGDVKDMRVYFRAKEVLSTLASYDSSLTRTVVGRCFMNEFRNFANAIPQRRYNPYDFAVIRLNRPAPAGTKFFELGTEAANPAAFPQLAVLGYGYSTSVIDGNRQDSDGNPIYKNEGPQKFSFVAQTVLPSDRPGFIRMDGTHDKGTCFGDSGGPIFYQGANSFVLVGLTSERTAQTNDSDQCNVDSMSIDLSSHVQWIRRAMKELRGPPSKGWDEAYRQR